jgi:hypothetical protein
MRPPVLAGRIRIDPCSAPCLRRTAPLVGTRGPRTCCNRPDALVGPAAALLHRDQSGKDVANPFGQLGMLLRVFAQARPLAPPVSLEEGIGQIVDRVKFARWLAHDNSNPRKTT